MDSIDTASADIDRLRRTQFPVSERYIYLNHAAVAPVSTAVRRAMNRIVRDVEEHGIAHIDDWRQLYAGARRSAGRLIGAAPEHVAFLKNTTDGLIAVALGVDWRRGDSVVLAEGEFPANVYPWLNLAERGVRVVRVPRRDGRLHVEDYATAIDASTRVLTVSSVQFTTGFRSDLKALGELCRQHDILFVVDGIQSVGALRMDVRDLGVDCLAADGHKWLMGPEGCALFYVSSRALRRLRVAGLGWASVASAADFFDYDTTLHDDARRFETGTQNTAGIAGLRAAMDLFLDLGMERVEQRVLALSQRLADGLTERGYAVHSSRAPGEASGIVTFAGIEQTSAQIAAALQAATVQLTERGGTVRLAPHVYNTDEEIDRALAALPDRP